MIRELEREQLNHLTVKTLARVFIMRAKEGLGCSQFEAEALTDITCYTTEALPSQPPVRCPVRKARAGGVLALPLLLLDTLCWAAMTERSLLLFSPHFIQETTWRYNGDATERVQY